VCSLLRIKCGLNASVLSILCADIVYRRLSCTLSHRSCVRRCSNILPRDCSWSADESRWLWCVDDMSNIQRYKYRSYKLYIIFKFLHECHWIDRNSYSIRQYNTKICWRAMRYEWIRGAGWRWLVRTVYIGK